ncbi:MAG: NUDIX domain-containing protein [Candidatus Magasanikbacteria bacterium]|nr:NUDIX domain-containing protein [Candidatus Magasanikbacteria bacterium]
MKQTKSAGGVVKNTKGKILVVSQHGTSWSLPKGHIEDNENTVEAAKREIKEESGVSELEHIKELGTYQRYKIAKDGTEDLSEFKTITMFLFDTPEENLKPIDPENPVAKWVNKEDVADLLTALKDKEFWLSVKDKLNN